MKWLSMGNIYTSKKIKQLEAIRIKNNDVFKLQFLYDRMHDWFVEEGWSTSDNSNFGETMFKKVEKQDGSKDFRIEWRLARPITPYLKAYWDIDYNVLFISDMEIIHEGKKMKTQKMDCDINMRIYIEYDTGGSWGQHWFLKNFAGLWKNRIYRDEILEYEDRISRDGFALQQTIKDYWKFKRWVDEPEFGTTDRPKGLPGHE